MKDWMRKYMAGRYGVDQLSLALLILSIVIYLLALPFRSAIFRLLALVPVVISYYRVLSRDHYKRQQENFKFIRFYTPVQKKCRIRCRQIKEIRTYKYFKCPSCHQTLRVPRKKGSLTITCPKCKNSFHQHS